MKKIILGIIIFLIILISVFYYFNNLKLKALDQNNSNQNITAIMATTSETIKTKEEVKQSEKIEEEKEFTVVEKQIGKIVSKEPISKVKTFTLEELKSYNNQEKCFTSINSKVYDITKYLGIHPGGLNNILKVCGRDGTGIFMAKHMGDEKPNIILRSMQVGIIQN